jgi:hypothetical protein
VASTGAEIYDSDSSNALSDALGTETLNARPIMPDDYREAPDAQSNQSWVWVSGRQFLKVNPTTHMEAFLLGPHHVKKGGGFVGYIGKDPVPISDIKDLDLISWWNESRRVPYAFVIYIGYSCNTCYYHRM